MVKIKLDLEERLLDFDFSKITCSKEIGGGMGYMEYCAGKSVEEILAFLFSDLTRVFRIGRSRRPVFSLPGMGCLENGPLPVSGE